MDLDFQDCLGREKKNLSYNQRNMVLSFTGLCFLNHVLQLVLDRVAKEKCVLEALRKDNSSFHLLFLARVS